jgi:pimeloyl-ACP methyl ester carboxylesterase
MNQFMNQITNQLVNPFANRPVNQQTDTGNEEALGLFATAALPSAQWSRDRSSRSERENPPRGKFIEVDGVRLHYVEKGSGAPLVLLHGNGSMAREFEIGSLMDDLAKSHRVIAFDRPGYGYSSRPRDRVWSAAAQAALLHTAFERLDIRRPTVLGHSWATLVAISLALQYPGELARLILVSGYYMPLPRSDSLILSHPALPVVGDLLRHAVTPLLGRLVWPMMEQKMFSPALVTAQWKAQFPVWMALRPSQIFASADESAMMFLEAARLYPRYRDLRLPVSIVAGRSDTHVMPAMHSAPLHAMLPDSELVMIEGGGHMIHQVSPERILEVIHRATASARLAD